MSVKLPGFDLKPEFRNLLALDLRPSTDFETRLLSQAEDLLSRRREVVAERDVFSRKLRARRSALSRGLARGLSTLSDFLRYFAAHPAAQAAMIVALSAAVFLLREQPVRQSYSDLPEFPKFNHASQIYEAERRAEEEAYEREVQYAHDSTSGGL